MITSSRFLLYRIEINRKRYKK